MDIKRNIKDAIDDMSMIVKEYRKMELIKELIGRKNWFNYDEFIEKLTDIIESGNYEI